MKSTIRLLSVTLVLAASLGLGAGANAQQAVPSGAQWLRTYNANREISLVGTVVKYDPASAIPPLGAHVTVQTASGQVDVHLGNARAQRAYQAVGFFAADDSWFDRALADPFAGPAPEVRKLFA